LVCAGQLLARKSATDREAMPKRIEDILSELRDAIDFFPNDEQRARDIIAKHLNGERNEH
jgi:hypothetical protein